MTETLPKSPLIVYLTKFGLPATATAIAVVLFPFILTKAPVSVTMFKPPLKFVLPIDCIKGILSTVFGVEQFMGGTKKRF